MREHGHIADELLAHSRLSRAQHARVRADLCAHIADALEAGKSIDEIRASLGDSHVLATGLALSPPTVRRSHTATAVIAASAATLAWYVTTAIRLGSFAPTAPDPVLDAIAAQVVVDVRTWCENASVRQTLRLIQATKGIRSPSLSARLAEPFFFAFVDAPSDLSVCRPEKQRLASH